MKKLVLSIVLLTGGASFAQQNDSIIESKVQEVEVIDEVIEVQEIKEEQNLPQRLKSQVADEYNEVKEDVKNSEFVNDVKSEYQEQKEKIKDKKDELVKKRNKAKDNK